MGSRGLWKERVLLDGTEVWGVGFVERALADGIAVWGLGDLWKEHCLMG